MAKRKQPPVPRAGISKYDPSKHETRLYGEAIGADAVITGEGEEYLKRAGYGVTTMTSAREIMMRHEEERQRAMTRAVMEAMRDKWIDELTPPAKPAISFPAMIDPKRLALAYVAAQQCEYLTSLEIEDKGVVVVMKDGDDYTTGLCPWNVVTKPEWDNPLIELIATMAKQRAEGAW